MRDFWRAWVYCGWGGGPSLLRRGENCRTARTRPGGPGRIYTRQPARGPCWGDMGLAGSKIWRLCCPILRLCWSILGLCWPTLALCWPVLGPRLSDLEAFVDPCWAKRSEKWEAKNHSKTKDILMVGGLSWGYVGPSWGYVGPAWGDGAPSWGYVGPSWGLCLRSMLAHVDPSWATRAEKLQNMGRAQNTAKRGCFWRPGVSVAGAVCGSMSSGTIWL